MEPYGDFTEAEVREAFNEQARALVEAGADAIIIETQTSLEELGLGIAAAKAAGAPCVIGSMAYDVTLDGSTFRTMMGIDPERAAEFMRGARRGYRGAELRHRHGYGARAASRGAIPAGHRPAGDGAAQRRPAEAGRMKVIYDETPEQMVDGVGPLLEAGANIIGACCGSTPEHIRAFRNRRWTRYLRTNGRRWTDAPSWNNAAMKTKLCDINPAAAEKLPEFTGDKSGIGVHYVDAYLKPMNTKLEDGTAVKCKRRGLKIVLSAGAKKGEGLMRRLAVSNDPVVMLDAALQEAAAAAGIELTCRRPCHLHYALNSCSCWPPRCTRKPATTPGCATPR